VTGENEHTNTLRAAYDFDAPRRDNNVFDGWRADIVDEFLARLEPGATVLELGAGAGQAAAHAAAQGFEVTAMDLSPANVDLARARGVNAVVGDFADPDFFIGEFDGVFAMNSLLHVPKHLFQQALAAVHRSLKQGGIAVIVVFGGVDFEGTLEDEWTVPPRFFSFYSDESFEQLPIPGFKRLVCEFRLKDKEEGLHPQVLTVQAL